MLLIGMAVGLLTLETLDGHSLQVSNYGSRNGTVLLFISARCDKTREAMPEILRIHETVRRKEILFLGLCANDAETTLELKSFSLRNDVNFPVYRDSQGKIARAFGAKTTLDAYLIDPEGALVHHGSFADADGVADMADAMTKLLEKKSIRTKPKTHRGSPLGDAGTPASADDPIAPLSFSSELIFEKISWTADHHCSSIAEAPNGDLLVVWYGGSFECADDQALYMSRRKNNDKTWSEPQVVTRGAFLRPPGNAVVFRVSPTRMMVLWDRMDEERPLRRGRWGPGTLMNRYSDDNGLTWSDDAETGLGVGGVRNVPLVLKTGELLAPMSGGEGCFIITADGGVTWRISGTIGSGGQPTAVQRSDGSLLCFLRSQPFILQSESRDFGATWTQPQRTSLRCPGASVGLCRLSNGHFVLVFNDSSVARSPISVSLSTDDGATWGRPVSLEANPGEYAYPSMIQSSDEDIHVTYSYLRKTIKHVEFSEQWMRIMMETTN